MISWYRFEELYPKGCEALKGMNPDYVYDSYVNEVKPYLSVISNLIAEGKVSEKQIKIAMGISGRLWNVCKELFEEFSELIESQEDISQLKADLLLMEGIEATEKKNPKMIEMYQTRYNPKYKPKGEDVKLELPKKLEINILDSKMEDEELEEYEPKI